MPVSRVTRTTIYRLRVTLRGGRPAVWRRLEVQGTITLPRLHSSFQALVGWLDYHPRAFVLDGVTYDDPELLDDLAHEDGALARLRDVAPRADTCFAYNDDLGNDWCLDLVVEATGPPDPAARYPRCTAGALAAAEDGGDLHGYATFRRAIGARVTRATPTCSPGRAARPWSARRGPR